MRTLDNWIFKGYSWIVLRWVKKHKYEKHKFDFLLRLKVYEIGTTTLLVSILLTYFALKQDWIIFGIWLTFAVIIGYVDYRFYQLAWTTKLEYDFIFANRKNALLNESMKRMCEEGFEESRKRRYISLGMNGFFSAIQIGFGHWWILPIFWIAFPQNYIFWINDFGDPSDQDKEPKKELSKILADAWQNLMGSMQPGISPI